MENGKGNREISGRRIRQVMPLPQGFAVMEPVVQENGEEKMELADGVPYCLALVEGESGDYVAPYDLTFCGGIADTAALVKIRHCPHCGKVMEPHMGLYDDCDVSYTCDCEKEEIPNEQDLYL